MVDSGRLLSDLTRLLGDLERDLRRQVEERADVRAGLLADYEAARRVGRTQSAFDSWIEEPITQGAVAWILGTVFARFLEDNGLVEPRLSGTGARYTRAVQEHQHYFQQHPTDSERDYLEHLFAQLSALPATQPLFDRRHNPLWRLPLSADAARQLVGFWQRIDPEIGRVAHDFADGALDTRFLGDLYQDLSEPVRKRYALLQTPAFVEGFILDRTLTPAIETFGYREVRVIDPTCGSGHFLLGSFERLLALAEEHEPARNVRALVADSLSRVVGIDINPYAVAIARFRLTVAALRACGITRLAAAPGFDIPVVVADSLLHGPRFAEDGAIQMSVLPDDPSDQYYFAEDEPRVKALLGRQYHAVMGNPPYITARDPALNALYRQRYGSCYKKYALVVPFMERFFELAVSGSGPAGFIGLIIGNSFMKREFGKKLITEFMPKWDLTQVVDTSGAFIPGHSTPTAILFGRNRRPQTEKVRAVMGIRGEPSTPEEPQTGRVWTAIQAQIDVPGSESEYVSVADLDRSLLHQHPWSIGGGGAAELKELLDDAARRQLRDIAATVGVFGMTNADDVMISDPASLRRRKVLESSWRPLVGGDVIRDWQAETLDCVLFPYDGDRLRPVRQDEAVYRWLWPYRTVLGNRATFSKRTYFKEGRPWWEWHQVCLERLENPLSIVFAAVATHNHFYLDRGGRVFKQSAPIIKLPAASTLEAHYELLALLNSSTTCFWMKQVFYPKGSVNGDISTEKGRPEANRYDFSGTGLLPFPVPDSCSTLLAALGAALDRTACRITECFDHFRAALENTEASALRSQLSGTESEVKELRGSLMCLQEELDWEVYRFYGLTSRGALRDIVEHPVTISDSLRPYQWPSSRAPEFADERVAEEYRRRRESIEHSSFVRLIESPVYKRPWFGRQGVFGHESETDGQRLSGIMRDSLLDRLESRLYWSSVGLVSISKLADCARRDGTFMAVAEVYEGRADFDVNVLVERLVSGQTVPFLPAMRCTDAGMRKRKQWEATWGLQRLEDAIAARVGLSEEDARGLTARGETLT